MAWVAVAVGGAALVGAYTSSQASNGAAKSQGDAANASNATQLQMYNQTREDNQAWRTAGEGALGNLSSGNILPGGFEGDPGYQFRLAEGNKALAAAASARGGNNSGRTMKELTRYGQDYASNEYNNAYNRQYTRLTALAGVGQATNQSNAAGGMNYANQVGQNNAGAANASGAAGIASANNLNSAIGTGANAWMGYQMMNRNKFTGDGAVTSGGTYFGSGNIA